MSLVAGAGAGDDVGKVTKFSDGITAAGAYGVVAGPDGNLWFMESNEIVEGATVAGETTGSSANSIGRITPKGKVTEFSTGLTPTIEMFDQSSGILFGLTAGPDGNLWFNAENAGRIGRITPDGVITEFPAGSAAGTNWTGITAGPDGNLWFKSDAGIGRITPNGEVAVFTVAGFALGLTAGPDGNLWFVEEDAEFGTTTIGRITPAGAITEFSIAGPASPYGELTAGADGNLWFALSGESGDGIGRITPAGEITEFSEGITGEPTEITAGPDGNLWFIEYDPARIGRITPAGEITEFSKGITGEPGWLTAACDGNLWFTEGKGRIARITPKGKVTEFSEGITGIPGQLAAGPDGKLWFGLSPNKIARFDTGPVAKAKGLPAACPRSKKK